MTWKFITLLCIICSSGLSRAEEVLSVEESTSEPVFQYRESGLKEADGNNDDPILEGDILVSNGDGGRKKRQIVKERQYHNKWSEGVYYIFNETAKNKPRLKGCFLKAARAWELNTCIDFKQGRPEKPDYGYLAVTDEYEYMSHVGRLGEEQPLSIGESCETEFGRAIHEVGHALGLYHFHSRYDRDRYITVRPNSMPHKDHEVEYAMVLRNESRNYGTSYDYGSVMHYGVNSENPVMIPANRYHNRTMGSAIISLVDYWLINKHYGCLENCAPEKSEKCANGGFAHPRNCDVCVCPTGYGGPYCNERPKHCGEGKNATEHWQPLLITIDNRKGNEYYANCTYWIRSPPGTVIEIKIEEEGIPGGFEEPGCTKAAVEIKTNKNQTLTGYRFCSEDDGGIKLQSHTNLVPIIAYSRDSFTFMARLKYHHVMKPRGKQERED